MEPKRWHSLLYVFLAATIGLTVVLSTRSQDLRSAAAGKSVGQIFCHGRVLCEDQHCEGDSWAACGDCSPGRAKVITQAKCGVYQETGCVFDQFTSCEEL
ncbi:MAG: hypothetical protein Q8N84_01535 [bacterium]|nr:hypothetical protein [bacterium]